MDGNSKYNNSIPNQMRDISEIFTTSKKFKGKITQKFNKKLK